MVGEGEAVDGGGGGGAGASVRAGGGGGGPNYFDPSVVTNVTNNSGIQTGNGQVILSWTAPKAIPSLFTVPCPKKVKIDTPFRDFAILSCGNNPTGTLVFTLRKEKGEIVQTKTISVSGNGVYHSPCFKVCRGGHYFFVVTYSGDAMHQGIVSSNENIRAKCASKQPFNFCF